MTDFSLTSSITRTTGEGRQGTAHAAADVSLRAAATVAGLGLLVMAILAGATYTAFETLVVAGDAATTAQNIQDHELRFRLILCGFLLVTALDVVVAWALYRVLMPVNRSIALLAAFFRLAYAAIFAAAISNLGAPVRLLTDADALNAIGTDQLHAQVMISVHAFNDGWDVALAIFGLHLLVPGYLVFKSGYIPRVIGILLVIASPAYLTDAFTAFLEVDPLASLGPIADVAMAAGEIVLLAWLLWKRARGFGGTFTARSATSP